MKAKAKRFIKGSPEAKAFMKKLRSKKNKSISGAKESLEIKKFLIDKRQRMPHGYETTASTRLEKAHADKKAHVKHIKKSYRAIVKSKPKKSRGTLKAEKFKKKHLSYLPNAKGVYPGKNQAERTENWRRHQKAKGVLSGNHTDKNSHNYRINISGLPGYQDEIMAREIMSNADNNAQLYFSNKNPILKNLTKKYKKGTFNLELSAKLWRYYVENAMKLYHKENGLRGSWSSLMNTHDRNLMAKEYADETLAEFQSGNFWEK